MRPVLAEWDSPCALCERRIREGDEIVRLPDEDGEWAHADCAQDDGYEVDR